VERTDVFVECDEKLPVRGHVSGAEESLSQPFLTGES
jgi:hypothetical protein